MLHRNLKFKAGYSIPIPLSPESSVFWNMSSRPSILEEARWGFLVK